MNIFLSFADGIGFPTTLLPEQAVSLVNNPTILIIAVVLIVATVLLLVYLKKIIVNTVLGLIVWAIVTYIFKVELPLIPSFVVSAIFGPAGIGVLLLLKFLGVM
jgi:hypothetical protein